MSLIRKTNPISIPGLSILGGIYESFDELRELPRVIEGKKYWLMNNDWDIRYFVSDDTTSPDQPPNTLIVAATGQRLKLIGSENENLV